jgi:hypothetical protein
MEKCGIENACGYGRRLFCAEKGGSFLEEKATLMDEGSK